MKKIIALLILGFCLTSFSIAFAGPVSSKLTPEELAKVKAGEIILKNDISKTTKAGSGIAYGVFKCTVDEFWHVIYDYPNYPDIFPRMNYAKVLDNNPDIFLTELSLDVTLSNLVYTSYNKPSKDKMRLDFGLEKNRPHKYFKEMGGYWQLEKLEDGSLLAEYKVNVALDIPLIGGMVTKIVNSMAGKDLPLVLLAVRKRIETKDAWKLSDGL